MSEIKNEFNHYAKKIWDILHKHESLTEDTLIKETKLDEVEFSAAIGWLSRQNKIYKDGDKYKIGETNLTGKIGMDAGKVWEILNSTEELDISSIAKLTNMSIKETYSAIGWLTSEDKIIRTITQNNDYQAPLITELRKSEEHEYQILTEWPTMDIFDNKLKYNVKYKLK